MEEYLMQFSGKRITCELANGTSLMGTIHHVTDGVIEISDSGIDGIEYVAVAYVVRFQRVR
jgi:hypothetical protein